MSFILLCTLYEVMRFLFGGLELFRNYCGGMYNALGSRLVVCTDWRRRRLIPGNQFQHGRAQLTSHNDQLLDLNYPVLELATNHCVLPLKIPNPPIKCRG